MNTVLHESFASVLRSGREEFNARFGEARLRHPELDPKSFSDFLHTAVNPLIAAVAATHLIAVTDVAMAAYDVGLELVAQKLAGARARHRLIEEGWREILPRVASLVAAAPQRILSATCNALHHLATTPGARCREWIDALVTASPRCESVEQFLAFGQVAAWHAGLAHFREGALAAADSLPPALATHALGAAANADWPKLRSRLASDPWFDPAQPNHSGVRVAREAGAFRGFGGLFIEPPAVAAAGQQFFVRSSDECWLLTADAFGATLHRASTADFESATRDQSREVKINGPKLIWNGQHIDLPTPGPITSAAANATTLAATSSLTHAVILIALV